MTSLSSFLAKWTTTVIVLAALTATVGVIVRGDVAHTLNTAALVLLGALPMLRVIALAVSWARAGDRRYAAAAVMLVSLMAVGVLVVAVWR
jgi:Na+/proline symporter